MFEPGILPLTAPFGSRPRLGSGKTLAFLFGILPVLVGSPAWAQGLPDIRQNQASISSELRAQLTPREYTTLASEMAGRIDKITTRIGEHFKLGDVLVEFVCDSGRTGRPRQSR